MQKQLHINKREILSRHFLFRQLMPTEIDHILALAVERHFQNGQSLFIKGDEGSSMMIVIEGKVIISATSEDGKEITLNYIGPGGILGEIALLDGKCRSANATAVGACTVIYIHRSEFIPFLRLNSDVAIQLLMVLCEKLRNTSDMLENVGLLSVPARLAKLIVKLATSNNAPISPGCTLRLNLSQQKMGNLIGASRETVNRTLAQWQMDGLICLQQQQLTLIKPKELIWLSETVL
ncbi:Crp/Fnr family transcriptional regulator [Candidatus Methylobacter favarea]|uniref:Crp/Fnr family transcriptional regulator n=1 Tax=Candidatus Methylobacter favarea TaxID=2707345 RepID=A0A8S0WRR8_9GAMM|nr:Crp/Fnr family transcriptional regulator [Candidatus Methylobacter favarea]CAA9892221.1 Crp/Fnr family transcriptional regulator [Candidatus Methylobacter favarea]